MAEPVQGMVFQIEVDNRTGEARLKQFRTQAEQTFRGVRGATEGAHAAAGKYETGLRGLADRFKDAQQSGGLLERALGGLGSGSVLAAAGFGLVGAAAVLAGKKIVEFAQFGEQASRVEVAFGTLSARIGQNADSIVQSLELATKGMVDNTDLMRLANQAILLELPVTADSFGALAEAAVRAGKAMGVDEKTAVDQLVEGLTRHNNRTLRAIGLTLDFEKAEAALAVQLGKGADQLTEVEKRAAAYAAALVELPKQTRDLQAATEALTLAQIFTRIGVEAKNAAETIAQGFNQLPVVASQFAQALEHPGELMRNIVATGNVAAGVYLTIAQNAEAAATNVSHGASASWDWASAANELRKNLAVPLPSDVLAKIKQMEEFVKALRGELQETSSAELRPILSAQIAEWTKKLEDAKRAAGLLPPAVDKITTSLVGAAEQAATVSTLFEKLGAKDLPTLTREAEHVETSVGSLQALLLTGIISWEEYALGVQAAGKKLDDLDQKLPGIANRLEAITKARIQVSVGTAGAPSAVGGVVPAPRTPTILPEVDALTTLQDRADDVAASLEKLATMAGGPIAATAQFRDTVAALSVELVNLAVAGSAVPAGLLATAEALVRSAAAADLLRTTLADIGPIQAAIVEVDLYRQQSQATGEELDKLTTRQVAATAGFGAVAAAAPQFGAALMRLVATGKGSAKDLRKALGESMAGLATEQFARAVVQLALGAAASTPWGAAALGPPAGYFKAAAAHAVAGAAAAAAARVLGAGGGSRTAGAGAGGGAPGGAGAGGGVAERPAPFSRPEKELRTVGGPFEGFRAEVSAPVLVSLSPTADSRLISMIDQLDRWASEVMEERRKTVFPIGPLFPVPVVPPASESPRDRLPGRSTSPSLPPQRDTRPVTVNINAVDAASVQQWLRDPKARTAVAEAVFEVFDGRG